MLHIDFWHACKILDFKTGYAAVFSGKQKTAEMPHELRRWDAWRKSV